MVRGSQGSGIDNALAVVLRQPADGGNPITSYTVRYWRQYPLPSAASWKTVTYEVSSGTTYLRCVFFACAIYIPLDDFAPDQYYWAQVYVSNSAGRSRSSPLGKGYLTSNGAAPPTATPTPTPTPLPAATAPEAPAAPTITGRDATILVAWNVPADGGSHITGYRVRYRPEGSATWRTVGISTRTCCLVALTVVTDPLLRYEAQVQASNAIGPSDWSASGSGYLTRTGVAPGEDTPTPTPTPTATPILPTATPTPTRTPTPIPPKWSLEPPVWSANTQPVVSAYRALRKHEAVGLAVRYQYRVATQTDWSEADTPALDTIEINPDTDRREPFVYDCYDGLWLCVAGLRSSQFYFAAVRGVNAAGEVTGWSEAWGFATLAAVSDYEFDATATPTGTPIPPTATSTVRPTPTVTGPNPERFGLAAPMVTYIPPGSEYMAGANDHNILNVQTNYTAPEAARDPRGLLNHYAIGVTADRNDAQRREGLEKNCRQEVECALEYSTDTDLQGNPISDAYVLYFWLSAYWLEANGAPAQRTVSKVSQFVNPLMQGRDARPGDEILYPGAPSSRYSHQRGAVTIVVEGMERPDSDVADSFETQVNDGRIATADATEGNASYRVELRVEEMELGFATLRTRGRVGPGASDGSDFIELLGLRFDVPPHGYLYSEWDDGYRVALGRGETTPVPLPVDAGLPVADENVEQAVLSLASIFWPETTRTEEGRDRWMTLAAIVVVGALSGGVLLLDWRENKRLRPIAVFSAAFIGSFAWIGLGLLFFGLSWGMVAIPVALFMLAGLFGLRKRL